MLIKRVDENSGAKEDHLVFEQLSNDAGGGFSLFGEEEYCFPIVFEQFYEKVLNFEVRDDDVYVATFPKCGTTWTQEMVWLLGNNLNYDGAKESLSTRFPFLEFEGMFNPNEKNSLIGTEVTESLELTKQLPSPRFIKCHLPWTLYPEQIQKGTKRPKIIYTCRNPKDCLVSFYYHAKLFISYKGTFDDYFNLFMAGRLTYTPFWSHIFGFWNRRHEENILFIHYEDMIKDLPSVIRKTADFLGKSYNDQEIDQLAKHLSFDSMKNNPAVNYEDLIENFRKAGITDSDGKFMRSGKIGDFKIHMTPEQIAQTDKWIEKNIKGTGFKIHGN